VLSTLLGVFAFSSFWGIREMFEQRKRVRKGWYPRRGDKS
jgi:peptide methionine sulfoxide reductase MsrA